MLNIYGKYAPTLDKLLGQMMAQFEQLNKNYEKEHGERLYEHLRGRVKSEASISKSNAVYFPSEAVAKAAGYRKSLR